MAGLREEVGALADEDLGRTLAERLDLPDPADEEALDRALLHVEEPVFPASVADRASPVGARGMRPRHRRRTIRGRPCHKPE